MVLTVAEDQAFSTSPDRGSMDSKEGSSPVDDQASSLGPESLIQLEGQLGDEDIVILHDTDKNHLKSAIEKLKVDIHNHLDGMTKKIQVELGHASQSAFKNIWLRYESQFYEVTMPYILELYTAAYDQVCTRLVQSVQDLTAADFDLENRLIADMLQHTDAYLDTSIQDDIFDEADNDMCGREDCDIKHVMNNTCDSAQHAEHIQHGNNHPGCQHDVNKNKVCDNNSDQYERSSVVEDDVHTNSTDTEKCDTLKSPDIYAM